MRIVAYEMKKMWNWKTLVIIAILCVLFYRGFMRVFIKYYAEGHSISEEMEFTHLLTEIASRNL